MVAMAKLALTGARLLDPESGVHRETLLVEGERIVARIPDAEDRAALMRYLEAVTR